MLELQQKLSLSSYTELYDLIIPKDNLLRQIKELVDFSFIYEELVNKYSLDNGRNAISPIRMFKYLLLKTIYDLSDIDVVERSKFSFVFAAITTIGLLSGNQSSNINSTKPPASVTRPLKK